MDNEPSKNHIPNLPLSLLSLRLGGITSPEKTADGYELRSRGPASRGFDVLDNLLRLIRAAPAQRAQRAQPRGACRGRVRAWHMCVRT
jgi:hypothetical protein